MQIYIDLKISPPETRNKLFLNTSKRFRKYLTNPTPPPTAIDKKIRKCNKVLHTKAVSQAINSYATNRVLGTKPPKIHQEENQLSRKTRVKLAQHRSGFVPDLFSYKHRIDESIPDNCPNCNLTPHDVIHLFNCPMKPTELKPIDLWNKPKKTALFLDLDKPPPAT